MSVLSTSNRYVINFGKFLWLNRFSQICVKPKTSNGFPWWLINMKRYVCLCVKMWWRLKAIFTAWFSMLTVLFYVFMFYALCFMFCDLHRLFFRDNHAALADYAWLGVQAFFLLGNYISVFCLCCFSWRKTYKYMCSIDISFYVLHFTFHIIFYVSHFTFHIISHVVPQQQFSYLSSTGSWVLASLPKQIKLIKNFLPK